MHFPDLCVQKWSRLPWVSDAFLKFSTCESCRKSCGRNSTIYAPKNEAVCCEVQTHFGTYAFQALWKSSGCIFPSYASKMKLFTVRFRRILEVFASQVSWKKLWVHFAELCVQKWSCLLWGSDAFCKLSACTKKLCAHFHDLCVAQRNVLAFNILWKCFDHVLWFFMPVNLCWVVRARCEVLDFHIL